MRLPFQRSWERRESPFHPLPQPKPPQKGGRPRPEVYTHPEHGI